MQTFRKQYLCNSIGNILHPKNALAVQGRLLIEAKAFMYRKVLLLQWKFRCLKPLYSSRLFLRELKTCSMREKPISHELLTIFFVLFSRYRLESSIGSGNSILPDLHLIRESGLSFLRIGFGPVSDWVLLLQVGSNYPDFLNS